MTEQLKQNQSQLSQTSTSALPSNPTRRTNLVLIGLPGSGKSVLGRQLAKVLKWEFIDIDERIVQAAGQSIPGIFAKLGEAGFRELETRQTELAAQTSAAVIATGGGVVTRPENMAALAATGLVVFIDRRPEDIVQDVRIADRPLLAQGAQAVFELSQQRRPLYLQYAAAVVSNDQSLEAALAELRALAYSLFPPAGFAVIGDPIGHSLSPSIHNFVFQELGVPADYQAIRVVPDQLPAFLGQVRESGLRGFNVTIPHKQAVLPALDAISPAAAQAGAVNTVVLRQGQLIGENTDIPGITSALALAGRPLANANVMLLGTGGAARAIALAAVLAGARRLTILGRRLPKAEEIRDQLPATANPRLSLQTADFSPASLRQAAQHSDLLINATPLGMTGYPANFETLDWLQALPRSALVCDIVYAPPRTALLAAAAERGLATLNGLSMLISQALCADELFLARPLDKAKLLASVTARLFSPEQA